MKKHIALLIALLMVPFFGLFAQATETEQDPAIALAKEETVVVYDLGRFFGYVLTVEKDTPKLALSSAQLAEFYDIMSDIKSTERIEPDWAEATLDHLELDVLTPDQLIAVDELAIARLDSRETESSDSLQKGGGTGSGPLTTYVAGGAFNPIVDETKSIGEGFFELYTYVAKKLGK